MAIESLNLYFSYGFPCIWSTFFNIGRVNISHHIVVIKNDILLAVIVDIGSIDFFLKTAREFWILSILVGSSQGGIQALSRSYFAKMIPKENSNEFFGFYNIFGKFAAIMGPFLVGIVTQITGDVRNGVLSLILIFIVGGVLLLKD